MSSRDGIGVIATRTWGFALAERATAGGRRIFAYGPEAAGPAPSGPSRARDLGEIAERCGLIVLALRAGEVRPMMREIGERLDGSHLLVHAVRGLEAGTLTSPSQVIAEESCVRKIGALLGPALSDDLRASSPTAAVVASRFPEVIAATQGALGSDWLRIYASRDLAGVEAAGAAASVMGFALGLCLGLDLGAASAAVLVTRGVAEMARLCAALGGDPRTAAGLAGLGDLLVQREAEGRDVQAGRRFARGASREAIEADLGPISAVDAVEAFFDLARTRRLHAPITGAVKHLLAGEAQLADVLRRLMSAAPATE
jgi:glycerol-3-phosphate dehydrogenase (NAD(P)+)